MKPVIYFNGWPRSVYSIVDGRGMVLNYTNGEILTEAHGPTLEDQIGKEIILYKTKTTFGGKRVNCLRLDAVNDVSEIIADTDDGAVPADDIPF